MSELTDHELLADFARSESGDAFAELVARYVNLVYSTALRCTGNAHQAEEITQAVFIILTRKAAALPPRVVLSGWLYQTTRFTAANFRKIEIRRQRREQEAYMQSTLNEPGAETWRQIAPLLEDAMGHLGETDRNAVVLRFFENKTAAEAAAILHLSEAAAQKRTHRALDKLRAIFLKHGVSSTTAIISGALSAHSIHTAPAAVAVSVKLAAAAKGAAVGGSLATLIQGALKLMAWTKAKVAISIGVGVLLGVGTAALLLTKILQEPDMMALQGTWSVKEIGAGPDLATLVIRGSTLEFRGADPAEWYKATFSLLKKTSPWEATIVIADCPEPEYVGKTARAIFKLDGDTFTIAGNEPGDPSLPASFDASSARKFTAKKESSATRSILTASALANAANNVTPSPIEFKSTGALSGWGDFINPEGDCTFGVVGKKLTINLPNTSHILTPETHRMNAPRFMQEITGPFDMQVKVTQHFASADQNSTAGRNYYQGAGLLIWMDDANNLKLAPAQGTRDGKMYRFFNLEFRHEGKRAWMPFPNESAGLLRARTFYLRLQIHEDRTTASVSGDGVKWFSMSLPGSGKPAKVHGGLVAENNAALPFTVDFEDFSVSSPAK